MRLKLKNTPEQVELIKAMGSKNQLEAREAQEAFAAFLGPVVLRVLNQAGTVGGIYSDAPYDEDDSPSFPLDLYYNIGDNHVSVWSQHMAGGLPTSHIEGMQEMKIATYRLDTAVSFLKRYARRARLDVVGKAVERMAQEVLIKQERNGWAVILKALGEAQDGAAGAAGDHILASTAENVFQLDDLNRMMTLNKRLNQSFVNGTPDDVYSAGVTDLYVSPEIVEQLRAYAYNPMNTRHGHTTPAGVSGTENNMVSSIALPEGMRERVYSSAGLGEIYGVNIVEMREFGVAQKYNTLFDTFVSGTDLDFRGSGRSFNEGGTDEVLVGIDNSRGAFIRPIATQEDSVHNDPSRGSFVTLADDQWNQRSEKLGFYGYLEEGRVCLDARAINGLVV